MRIFETQLEGQNMPSSVQLFEITEPIPPFFFFIEVRPLFICHVSGRKREWTVHPMGA